MTDQELIAGIINRNHDAIGYLVEKYHRQVIKTAFYFVQDMDDAEDIAQDVCLDVLESANNFRGNAAFTTWIYRITVNKSLNHIKKNKRKALISRFEDAFTFRPANEAGRPTEPAHRDDPLLDDENRQILRKALNRLPESQRTAITLSLYEELPHKQIAEIMKISLASAESLLQRARQNLQRTLLTHFEEYSKKTNR